ncbi:TnsA-like heteromeric transposase endonuclease subunit [Saccharothrix lopnurensis]|uniref:TnsA-like heteromeric transposase endonuclease subunit n=1 Tax=Saccharothrix lopnurensis TaxID=1670621 RepID=A0ABW1NXI7_9PSEU
MSRIEWPRARRRVGVFGPRLRIRYIDQHFVEHAVAADAAAGIAFERSRMVRRIPSYPGQKHTPGRYWSATLGHLIEFESWLECQWLTVLDFDPQVVGMASQPLEFDGADPDGAWRHVPDIFVRLADGSARLVDVKNPDHHDRDDVQRQARRTRAACADLGWGYQFVGAIEAQRWRNISWLSAYRRPLHGGIDLIPRILALTTRPVTLAELLSFLDESAIVLPVIFHLCWRGQLVFDLDAPMRQNTVLRQPEHTPAEVPSR